MYEEYLVRIFLAALVGGAIGLEREYRDKSAGFRTMILISTGSALFTIISEVMGSPINDDARIAAAVVSGVGFLGAGVILKDGADIKGLTTAASIWIVSALGMGMGLGMVDLIGYLTVAILVVLWFLPPLERFVDALHEFRTFHVAIKNTDKQDDKVLALFAELGVRVVHVSRSQNDSKERILHIKVKTNAKKLTNIGKALANEKSVLRFGTVWHHDMPVQ